MACVGRARLGGFRGQTVLDALLRAQNSWMRCDDASFEAASCRGQNGTWTHGSPRSLELESPD